VVFVDEVHRFNKAQQDAFLPHVESGLFSFIGATTENPSFEVNSALLSRSTVHVLKSLDDADLGELIARAQALLQAPPLSAAAHERLVAHADGDARRLLNAYENLAAANTGAAELGEAQLEATLGELLRRGDKGGDVYYDTISALHKAVRGSDPDASLYWLARLLDAGMDPRYAARRLIRWRWPRRWSTWPSRPSPTPSTRPGTGCATWCAKTVRARFPCTCAMPRRS
jgi:putative ATPase